MALVGIELTTWLGYFFGIIILRAPWGLPTLPTWFTFSSIYSLLILAFNLFNLIDVFSNAHGSFSLTETQRLAQLTTKASLQIHVLCYFYYKLYFLVKAKQLANFMLELHYYPLAKPIRFRTFILECFLVSIGHLCFLVAMAINLVKARNILFFQASVTWLGNLMYSKTLYIVIFYGLQVVAQGVAENTVFSLLISFSNRLRTIIENFGDDTVEIITNEMKAANDQCAKLNNYQKVSLNDSSLRIKCARHQILVRFGKVQNICGMGYRLMAPLFFTIIFLGTCAAIMTGSKSVILKRTGWSLATDVIRIIGSCLYTGVFEVGERVNRKVKEMKLKIFQSYLKISWEPEFRNEVKEMVEIIQKWQWKLSAAGLFSVERKLARGVSNFLKITFTKDFLTKITLIDIVLDDFHLDIERYHDVRHHLFPNVYCYHSKLPRQLDKQYKLGQCECWINY